MNTLKKHLSTGMVAALLLLGLSGVQPALAADEGFVSVQASGSYDDTVSKLRKLVAGNGMMVLGEINQGKVMTNMTGMHLKAVSLFVGNPNVGKKLFSADAGVGIVLPVRVNVYESHGETYVNYFKPSAQLEAFHEQKLVMMGQMLDEKLARMTGMLGK